MSSARVLVIAAHHKGGASWLRRVMQAVSNRCHIPLIDVSSDPIPDEGRVLVGHWDGPLPEALLARRDAAFLHLVRDPRDVMIAGAHDHHVIRADVAPWAHMPLPEAKGQTYQQALQSLDGHADKLRFEMHGRHARTVADMASWPAGDPRIVRLEYEDMMADADGWLFQAALAHLGLDEKEQRKGVAGFQKMTAFAPASATNRPSRWPREFPAALGPEYAREFGDALIRLGYETDGSWTAQLRETVKGPDFPTSARARDKMADTEADARRYLRSRGLVAVANKETSAHLRAFDLNPDHVIDVGVDHGTPFLYAAFPDADFLLIDPRKESETAVASANPPARYRFECAAVGPSAGEVELRIPVTAKGSDGAMAGIRARTDAMAGHHKGEEVRSVPMVTLDSLTADMAGRIGLKIDTEGFEHDVLLGAAQTLLKCDFVILEMSVTSRFEGVARPSQITALLAAAGLEFRDVLRTTGDGRGGPTPRLFDVLYTRWQG